MTAKIDSRGNAPHIKNVVYLPLYLIIFPPIKVVMMEKKTQNP